MVDTIQRPPSPSETDERVEHRNRTWKIAVVVLAIVALVLGGIAVYSARDSDDGATSVPDDVQQLLEDFEQANENADADGFLALVTDDFRNTGYRDETDEVPARSVQTADNIAASLRRGVRIDVERFGDPVVVEGDGTWFVAYSETWAQPGSGTENRLIHTYSIVDEDGTPKIDDAYMTGAITLIEE